MTDGPGPRLCQVVLDCTDARALAEFYRALLGLVYRPGDEPPGRFAALELVYFSIHALW